MEKEDVENLLFKNTEAKEKYGEKYIDHFLDQYKTYLSMLDNISDRRQKSNEFFLSLNTVIIGALGYVETKDIPNAPVIFFIVPVVGALISFFWYHIIHSYKNLNTAKFAVVHSIEQRLPITMFETEWKLLDQGTNKKKYYPFTHIELHIPKIFIGIYIFLLLINIPWTQVLNFVQHLFCY